MADLLTGSFESTSWTFSVKGTESRFCFVRVSSTSPHGSPISSGSLFPSSGRFGVCAFSGRRWSRFGRLVQVLPSLSPRPLVLVRFRRPPLFFSLAFSGFARSGPGVLVCVSLSFLSCVPLSGPG